MVDCNPTDEKLVEIMEGMFTSLYSWIIGDSFVRCYLSIIYFHEDTKEYLIEQCFKKENVNDNSLLLLSAVNLYINIFSLVSQIVRMNTIVEVTCLIPCSLDG